MKSLQTERLNEQQSERTSGCLVWCRYSAAMTSYKTSSGSRLSSERERFSLPRKHKQGARLAGIVSSRVVLVAPILQVLLDRRAQHAALCGPLVAPRGDVVPGARDEPDLGVRLQGVALGLGLGLGSGLGFRVRIVSRLYVNITCTVPIPG